MSSENTGWTLTDPEWTDDSVQQCERCSSNFTLIKRRHHCRKCGSIVCQACSLNQLLIPNSPYKEPVRVCVVCFVQTSSDPSGTNGKLSPKKKESLKPPPLSPMKVKTVNTPASCSPCSPCFSCFSCSSCCPQNQNDEDDKTTSCCC